MSVKEYSGNCPGVSANRLCDVRPRAATVLLMESNSTTGPEDVKVVEPTTRGFQQANSGAMQGTLHLAQSSCCPLSSTGSPDGRLLMARWLSDALASQINNSNLDLSFLPWWVSDYRWRFGHEAP